MFFSLSLLLALTAPRPATNASPAEVTARIDALVEAHWRREKVQPAPRADDPTFLRRATLDLLGRIPTRAEAAAFQADRSPEKRRALLTRLAASPEFPLHLGRVLEEIIQGKAGNEPEFLEYVRGAVAARKPWDRVYQDILLGPWDKDAKGAERFLARRLNNLDDLTNDIAKTFFGVNVSCAKCHDHPLVADWKQDHYYGMASFLNPTYEGSKGKNKGNGGPVGEKATGEVTYVTTKGERRTAKVMFLSGKVAEAKPTGRRELLVRESLAEKTFFRRNIANRLWAYYFGRGLVHPLDQVHSANPPSVAGLLEWLGDDLAAHGYDLRRLVLGIVSSRVYALASTKSVGDQEPADKDFARAELRPLTPQQYALSLHLALGEGGYDKDTSPEARTRRYRELEGRAGGLTRGEVIDPRTDKFQSSTGEALFFSNHPDVQKLLAPSKDNLVGRLAALGDAKAVVDEAMWALLGRPAAEEERSHLASWLEARKGDRARACGQLVWALMTSAEFRFNH